MALAKPMWLGVLYLIGRASAKVKLKYKYDRKEDSEFMWPISRTDELMQSMLNLQPSQMMSQWSIPAVSRASPYASSYICRLGSEGQVDKLTASLYVKPST